MSNKRKTHKSEKEKNHEKDSKNRRSNRKTKAGERISQKEANINSTLFRAYKSSQERGLDAIDFNDVIWNYDVETIVDEFRIARHETFTISSTFSSFLETIWEFKQYGCRIKGMKQVRQEYENFNMDTMKSEPAYKPAAIIRL